MVLCRLITTVHSCHTVLTSFNTLFVIIKENKLITATAFQATGSPNDVASLIKPSTKDHDKLPDDMIC